MPYLIMMTHLSVRIPSMFQDSTQQPICQLQPGWDYDVDENDVSNGYADDARDDHLEEGDCFYFEPTGVGTCYENEVQDIYLDEDAFYDTGDAYGW